MDSMGTYGKGNVPKRGEGTSKHVIKDCEIKLHKYILEHNLKQDHNIQEECHHITSNQNDNYLKTKKASQFH